MKKKYKHIQLTKTANAELRIEINGVIEYDWTSRELKEAIDDAVKTGVEKVDLYLNTAGGNVYEATEIVNQLKRLPNVNITAGALVASAGTYILSHFPARAYADSQFMIHKPSTLVKGNEDVVKSDLKALENLTIQYRNAYAKRFSKTPEEIGELWQQDFWFNATEAKKLGLINEIIEDQLIISAESIAMMQACGCPNIPKEHKKQNVINNKMDRKLLISTLEMSADATDEQIQQKLAELKEKAESKEVETQTRANALVDKAIKEKRITADSKEAYVNLALSDYNQTKKALESLPQVVAGSEFVNKRNSPVTDKSNWTLDDYLEKDPDAFEALMESDPEKVRELNRNYQSKK